MTYALQHCEGQLSKNSMVASGPRPVPSPSATGVTTFGTCSKDLSLQQRLAVAFVLATSRFSLERTSPSTTLGAFLQELGAAALVLFGGAVRSNLDSIEWQLDDSRCIQRPPNDVQNPDFGL